MNTFTVESNNFLSSSVNGFFHTDYLGYYNPENPSYLNTLKNTFDSYSESKLSAAENEVERVLEKELPLVKDELGLSSITVCVMPRAKTKDNYSSNQLRFLSAVSDAIEGMPGFVDGTDWLVRIEDTQTTHLSHREIANYDNNGPKPYVGITLDTCHISSKVRGKDIILIDDIYTKTVNVNEDAIQALLDKGARSVTLYVVAKTKKKFH